MLCVPVMYAAGLLFIPRLAATFLANSCLEWLTWSLLMPALPTSDTKRGHALEHRCARCLLSLRGGHVLREARVPQLTVRFHWWTTAWWHQTCWQHHRHRGPRTSLNASNSNMSEPILWQWLAQQLVSMPSALGLFNFTAKSGFALDT